VESTDSPTDQRGVVGEDIDSEPVQLRHLSAGDREATDKDILIDENMQQLSATRRRQLI
jgi:hypothetical protein